MNVDVDHILDLLDQTRIDREILMAHDEARESFRLPRIAARDHREFKWTVTAYFQHHMRHTGQGSPSEDQAFGEVERMLNAIYEEDQFQDGYAVALQRGRDGSRGGMRDVLNQIADALKRQHLQKYISSVYHEHIDVQSKEANLALSRAFFRRFGPLLQRFGVHIDENTFAWNTRAALEYHRQVIEHILGIAKKV